MLRYYDLLKTNLQKQRGVALELGSGESLSYRLLYQRSQEFRKLLRSQCLGPTTAVVVGIPLSGDTIAALLALMAEGYPAVFLPPSQRRRALRSLSEMGYRRAVLLPQSSAPWKLLLAKLGGLKPLYLDQKPNCLKPSSRGKAQDIALISYSSGSTGAPKAILRSHRVLIAQHRAISRVYPTVEQQVDFPLFPNLILHNLAMGIPSVLPDIPRQSLPKMQASRIFAQIRQSQVNSLTGNVYYLRSLLQYGEEHSLQLPSLREVGIGGSPVPEHLLSRWQLLFPQARLHITYGSTEAEPIALRSYRWAQLPLDGYAVGSMQPELDYRFTQTQEIRLSAGKRVKSGALEVRGAHVIGDQHHWLSTGDYGYLQGGQLFLTGRKGNEGVWGGRQHYQLEHYLWQDEQIHAVAARSGPGGFAIYYSGPASPARVRAKLEEVIDLQWIRRIQKKYILPYDQRHQSKILYAKLAP